MLQGVLLCLPRSGSAQLQLLQETNLSAGCKAEHCLVLSTLVLTPGPLGKLERSLHSHQSTRKVCPSWSIGTGVWQLQQIPPQTVNSN